MARVRFTNNLAAICPDLNEAVVDAGTVRARIDALDERHPRLVGYLRDESGALRRHVNVFVRGEPIRDREVLSDPLRPGDEVYVVQALSGG